MLLWSDEIERRAKAAVAEIPMREKLRWFIPKREFVKRDRMGWALLAGLLFLGLTGLSFPKVSMLCIALMGALFKIQSHHAEDRADKLSELLDECSTICRSQHDQLLARTFVNLTAELQRPADPRMN